MKVLKYNELNETFSDNYPIFTKLDRGSTTINGNITAYTDEEYEDFYMEECSIYWNYDIQTARYGIEGVTTSIGKVTLDGLIDLWTNQSDEDTEQIDETMEFTVENSNIIVEDKQSVGEFEKQTLPYYPTEITFEKIDGKVNITVKF